MLSAAMIAMCAAAPAFAASLSTGFAAGNSLTGNMFDIEIGAAAITITALEVALLDGDSSVQLYYRLGDCAGATTSATGWTFWDIATALPANASGPATPWDVLDLTFSARSTYGI
jgi:hypothetical protein